MYIILWIFKKGELRKNMYSAKISTFTVVISIFNRESSVNICKTLVYLSSGCGMPHLTEYLLMLEIIMYPIPYLYF